MTDHTSQVRAELRLLYQCGKVHFPERAAELTEMLTTIGEVHDEWYAPTIRAGSPAALVKAREINELVFGLLRELALSWQDAALAMVSIAKDFEETDRTAGQVAREKAFKIDTMRMPKLPKPPTLGEVES